MKKRPVVSPEVQKHVADFLLRVVFEPGWPPSEKIQAMKLLSSLVFGGQHIR